MMNVRDELSFQRFQINLSFRKVLKKWDEMPKMLQKTDNLELKKPRYTKRFLRKLHKKK